MSLKPLAGKMKICKPIWKILMNDFSPVEGIVEVIEGEAPEIIDQDHLGNVQSVEMQVKHAQMIKNLEKKALQEFNNYLDKLRNSSSEQFIEELEKLNHFLEQSVDPQRDSAFIRQRQASQQ